MGRDQERVERIGRNEARFRDVNERIEAGRDRGQEQERIGFVCECGRPDCTRLIELSPSEFERVRRRSDRFVVAEGHVFPEAERVVERNERYWVVEKLDEAAEAARRA